MRSSPTDSPQPAHSELAEQVTHMLSAYGPLARDNPSYRQRDGQLDMACAVADAIARSEALVVEAGTGVGKTFAYLIPALLSGERVLVSTATKNLQDQLFTRDLPYLTGLLGLPLRKALLKGRSSYLCLYRLELARQDPVVHLRELQAGMHRIEQFARSTCSGDMSELEGVDERSPLLPLVTSTRDNCLGQQCPHSKNCHVNLARREAMAADVVVVNHHLFFADMAVRESGVAELLPTVHTVIFDEAHQLNDIGTQFLGQQLSSSHVLDFNRDMLATGMQLARGLAPWQELSRDLEQAVREWRLAGGRHATGTRLRWTGEIPEGLDPDVWLAAMRGLQERLQQTQQALDMMSELGPDFVRLRQRAAELIDKVQLFRHPCADESVRWLDASGALRLVQSPLDIARVVREKLLQGNAQAIPELADARAGRSKTMLTCPGTMICPSRSGASSSRRCLSCSSAPGFSRQPPWARMSGWSGSPGLAGWMRCRRCVSTAPLITRARRPFMCRAVFRHRGVSIICMRWPISRRARPVYWADARWC